MHQQRPDPAGHTPPRRQPSLLGTDLPACLAQALLQPLQGGGGIGAGQGFGEAELAELARFAVVDPAQRGLQGGPLASPAAEQQRQAQPGQQGQKPAAAVDVIELQGQHATTTQDPEPGGAVVALVVEGLAFTLRDGGADAAGDGDQQQQHDGRAQISDPGDQALQRPQQRRWHGSAHEN